jgi:chromosome partitioning protein
LSQVTAVGPERDDPAAVLQELYPDVPVPKARLGQHKAFMQALIFGQAIAQFDRPISKAVGEIKALFREVRSRF